MSVLIVVHTAPCGSSGPHDAFRVAGARIRTIHDFAAATARGDTVVSF